MSPLWGRRRFLPLIALCKGWGEKSGKAGGKGAGEFGRKWRGEGATRSNDAARIPLAGLGGMTQSEVMHELIDPRGGWVAVRNSPRIFPINEGMDMDEGDHGDGFGVAGGGDGGAG